MLAKAGGNSTITTVSGLTDAACEATFTVTNTTAETTTYTATDTTDTLTVTQTATVTFTSGVVSATQSTVSAAPTAVTADGIAASTVTVTLRDVNGNPVGQDDQRDEGQWLCDDRACLGREQRQRGRLLLSSPTRSQRPPC